MDASLGKRIRKGGEEEGGEDGEDGEGDGRGGRKGNGNTVRK